MREDNYTSVSRKGQAIVGYFCIPEDNFNQLKNFKVTTVQSIVSAYGLHGLLGERSKLPDRNTLFTEFNILSSENVGQSHGIDIKIDSNDLVTKINYLDFGSRSMTLLYSCYTTPMI